MGSAERKQREKETRRKQIMSAAEVIFLKKGFNNATMDEVADACELSKGTLYLYFKNKEELVFQIIIGLAQDYVDLVETNLAKCKTCEERLTSIGESYLEFYHKNPTGFKLMNNIKSHEGDGPRPTERGSELERELLLVTGRIWQIVEEIIQEGVDIGLFRKEINPLQVGISVWASSTGIINIMEHVKTHHLPLEETTENITPNSPMCKFKSINFEKMLRDIWRAIFNDIRA